jgi:hypothetical protein
VLGHVSQALFPVGVVASPGIVADDQADVGQGVVGAKTTLNPFARWYSPTRGGKTGTPRPGRSERTTARRPAHSPRRNPDRALDP